MEEAVGWLKRAPFDDGVAVEIRPVFEAENFGKELTPELQAQEARWRAESERPKRRRRRKESEVPVASL